MCVEEGFFPETNRVWRWSGAWNAAGIGFVSFVKLLIIKRKLGSFGTFSSGFVPAPG
jgi:hypothetical protein